MKHKILMACWALCCLLLVNCTDDAFLETSKTLNGRFELTVSKGDAATRLELGADGLSTMWEPGDKLVLVDKARSQAPIFLSCTLDEPAETATFVAEGGVPAGDYWVIYNYNENLAYGHVEFMSVDEINAQDKLTMYGELTIEAGVESASISLKHLYAMVKVTLKNVPAEYANYGDFNIGMYSSKKGFPMYKLFSSNGLVDAEYGYDFNSMNYIYNYTYFQSNRKRHNVRLGHYQYSNYSMASTRITSAEMQERVALIIPEDLTGEDLYFYINSYGDWSGYDYYCYEIKKSDVKFVAGKRYTVNLDMNAAIKTTLSSQYMNDDSYQFSLATPAEWRAAAYRNSSYVYKLAQDIDFDGDVFFPINSSNLHGENNKLSNITLDWEGQDYVGLFSFEDHYNADMVSEWFNVKDLTLENVTFKGGSYVGALAPCGVAATNCEVIGTSVISGTGDYVGGLVGIKSYFGTNNRKLEDVSVGQYTTVTGRNYVGGIVGACKMFDYMADQSVSHIPLSSCTSWATVTGSGNYVGGIFGSIGGNIRENSNSSSINFTMEDYTFSLQKCVNKGKVTGKDYVGGIGGYMGIYAYGPGNTLDRAVIMQSASEGDVTGEFAVGGIAGYSVSSFNTCYSIENIDGKSFVGGIVGKYTSMYSPRVANCYSITELTTETGGCAGGIVGGSEFSENNVIITNCYFAGTNPTDCGIIGAHNVGNYGNGICDISNCLTTLSSLGATIDTNREIQADHDVDGDWDVDADDIIACPDIITNSFTGVSSIKAQKSVINGDNAYSDNTWSGYNYECVKFGSFSADIDSPDYSDETIN